LRYARRIHEIQVSTSGNCKQHAPSIRCCHNLAHFVGLFSTDLHTKVTPPNPYFRVRPYLTSYPAPHSTTFRICSYFGKYLILWRLTYYRLQRESQIFRPAWNRLLTGQKVAKSGHFWDQSDDVPGRHCGIGKHNSRGFNAVTEGLKITGVDVQLHAV